MSLLRQTHPFILAILIQNMVHLHIAEQSAVKTAEQMPTVLRFPIRTHPSILAILIQDMMHLHIAEQLAVKVAKQMLPLVSFPIQRY